MNRIPESGIRYRPPVPTRAEPVSREVVRIIHDHADETFTTQVELSRKSGVTQSQISRLYGHRAPLSVAHMFALCSALGISAPAVLAEAIDRVTAPPRERGSTPPTAP
ncbi:hypothetical protein GCM10027071_15480 [Microbacterium marinum]